jgi:hypothetical protein
LTSTALVTLGLAAALVGSLALTCVLWLTLRRLEARHLKLEKGVSYQREQARRLRRDLQAEVEADA